MTHHTTPDPSPEISYGYCHCGCGRKTRVAEKTVRGRGLKKGEPFRFIRGHNGRLPIATKEQLCECGCGEPAPICTFTDPKRGYVRGQPHRFVVGHWARIKQPRSPQDRFWEKVRVAGPTECWEWQASTANGYGRFRIGNTCHLAHRFSFELHNGPIPSGMLVCHACDNPPCVNPDHLFLGTIADNNRDMAAKNRTNRIPRTMGEDSHYARLTAAQVLEIRQLAATGNETQTAIAARFGMTSSAISRIVLRQAWKHI